MLADPTIVSVSPTYMAKLNQKAQFLIFQYEDGSHI